MISVQDNVMGRAYKNFWALNTDEAVVAGILRDERDKDIEVFLPLNAQMKDVDLILVNMKHKKLLSVQVKGSKAYEPKKNETEKFGEGSTGWFFFPKDVIEKSTADFFIFLIYVIEQHSKTGRRTIEPHTITIPTHKIKELAKNNKIPHGDNRYSFYFWVNPKKKEAFDWRDKRYDVSEYLDSRGFEILNNSLI